MEKGKITILVAVISMVGVLGAALIASWGDDDSAVVTKKEEAITALKSDLSKKETEYDELLKKYNVISTSNRDNEALIRGQEIEIDNLKVPFHKISNTKLKQLIKFHNDAVCYGNSLNFTHDSSPEYEECVAKEVLAKRFLLFFEELELAKVNSTNYSRARAKQELIILQDNYNFRDPGWYTEFMLGILIIEYAKKA